MTKEEKKEYNKQYRLKHANELNEYQKKYRLEHPDKKNAWDKQYRLDHADTINEKAKEYRKTPKGRAYHLLHTYNQRDILRGFDTSENITLDWIIENVFSGQRCIYCGESDWKKLGVDRVDNKKPHTPDNVVCCCGECNVKRNKHYTFEEFKEKKAKQ